MTSWLSPSTVATLLGDTPTETAAVRAVVTLEAYRIVEIDRPGAWLSTTDAVEVRR